MSISQFLKEFEAGLLTMTQLQEKLESYTAALQKGVVEINEAGTHLDVNREQRLGFPEVIYGEGKTAEQILNIMNRLSEYTDRILATRVDAEKGAYVLSQFPEAQYDEVGRTLTWRKHPVTEATGLYGKAAVVCAGTSDLPVASEAAATAAIMGCEVIRIHDVGVAGIHRLFAKLDQIREADVIIVVAGMEGALASVLGGLVDKPMIAVPTSIGYGAHYEGLAALLSMLNSCAPGVTVVNIDNGFGAGYAAATILRNRGNVQP
ncbi:nickel pincer cofactor biosynthesis protein LarB [Marinicrinis sediminis]|uniref:Nickel pincer cofactor biosynthesis protein LarB n=1 Tax=Marinicrinis sediminis TaxID=1652465 RepID=A0ABW5R6S9_9BACL